jgi:hypothetical protein
VKNIRRKDRQIQNDEVIRLLGNCDYGVLSTVGSDNQPYGVPLNYVYQDNCIYFHSAITGHKIENLESNSKVSFCIVGRTKVLPNKFTTEYESAVIYGTATIVQGEDRQNALLLLLKKYSPEHISEGKEIIQKQDKATKVIRIEIEHMTGKARR